MKIPTFIIILMGIIIFYFTCVTTLFNNIFVKVLTFQFWNNNIYDKILTISTWIMILVGIMFIPLSLFYIYK